MRATHDYYPTPPGTVAKIMPCVMGALDGIACPRILEPGAGDGRIIKSLLAYLGNRLSLPVAIEVEWRNYPSPIEGFAPQDFLHWEPEEPFDLVIANPPFSLALEFFEHSLHCLRDGGHIFFLLRLGFLASKRRHERLWSVHPPEWVYVLVRRPSFTKGGTDVQEYAWYHWCKGDCNPGRLGWL